MESGGVIIYRQQPMRLHKGEYLMSDLTLNDAFQRFLMDAMVGAEHTRRTYRTALRALEEYLRDLDIDPETTPVTKLDVARALNWSTWLQEKRGISNRTLHTYLAALARFMRYLQIHQLGNLSGPDMVRFQDGLRQLRRSQSLPQLLPHPPTLEQVEQLRRTAREMPATSDDQRAELRRLRDIAILETLRSSGMRVGELVSIKRKQLRAEDRSAWVVGKGGKERQIFFDADAWHSVQTYLKARQPVDASSGRALGDLPVIARHDKKSGKRVLPMSTGAVERVLSKLTAASGLAAMGITPHSLRHYFATRIYQTTRDLAVTQTALGHSSPTTTRIYAKLEDDAVRVAHDAAFGKTRA